MVLVIEIIIYVTCASLGVFITRQVVLKCVCTQIDRDNNQVEQSGAIISAQNLKIGTKKYKSLSILEEDAEVYHDSYEADNLMLTKSNSMYKIKNDYILRRKRVK